MFNEDSKTQQDQSNQQQKHPLPAKRPTEPIPLKKHSVIVASQDLELAQVIDNEP